MEMLHAPQAVTYSNPDLQLNAAETGVGLQSDEESCRTASRGPLQTVPNGQYMQCLAPAM